jgi:hypothetical protein
LLELTPLAATIVERLFAGDTLGESIVCACASENARADPVEIAKLLSDLGGRGILLGGIAR